MWPFFLLGVPGDSDGLKWQRPGDAAHVDQLPHTNTLLMCSLCLFVCLLVCLFVSICLNGPDK